MRKGYATPEEERLGWAVDALCAATRLLAEGPEEQLRHLTQAALGIGYAQLPVDELAFQFEDGAILLDQLVEAALVSEDDARQLSALDGMLEAFSGAHNAHLWTPEALRTSQEWQDIRARASGIHGFGDADAFYFHVDRGEPGVSLMLTGRAGFDSFAANVVEKVDRPELVKLAGPYGRTLAVGMGNSESVLGWQETENLPRFASKGRVDADQPVVAFFWGQQRTEFPLRHVIANDIALEAVKLFLATGTRPDNVEWAAV